MECRFCEEYIMPGASYCDCGRPAEAARAPVRQTSPPARAQTSSRNPVSAPSHSPAPTPAPTPPGDSSAAPREPARPPRPRDRGLLGGVFGIGVGRLRILLPNRSFAPREMLVGKIVLDLSSPVVAHSLIVWIQAEKTESSYFTKSTTHKTWTGQKVQLAGPGEYQYEEFDFGLPVFDGPGGNWGHAVADFLLNGPRWTVQAKLETPEVSIGINGSQSFTVSES